MGAHAARINWWARCRSLLGTVLVLAGLFVLLFYLLVVALLSFYLFVVGMAKATLAVSLFAYLTMGIGFLLLASTGESKAVRRMGRTAQILDVILLAIVGLIIFGQWWTGALDAAQVDPKLMLWLAMLLAMSVCGIIALRWESLGRWSVITSAALSAVVGLIAPSGYNELMLEPAFALVGLLFLVASWRARKAQRRDVAVSAEGVGDQSLAA